ncbi:MAG: putative solute:sodium symporter small subunit [Halopseudomonas sp.]|jgi:putative solute:sodium symporter small subunit
MSGIYCQAEFCKIDVTESFRACGISQRGNNNKVESKTMDDKEKGAAYWSANLRLIFCSLIIWALVSFGFGIILRPMLSGISVGGADLGFWFAQQGSILVFVVLIFFYAWRMNRLDKEHGLEE